MPSCPAPSRAFGSSTDSFRNVHSRTPGELRGHSRFRRWRLLLTLTHIGFMIVSITAPVRWTKIHKHGCSCFPMSLKQSNSSNAFVLVSSSTCVFQGGIKMHDRNTWKYRLPGTTSFLPRFHRSPVTRYHILFLGENRESDRQTAHHIT